jgi:RNA polymerase sigma factor (sigma-70 family)
MATAGLTEFLDRLTRGMAAEVLAEETDRQLLERCLARRDEPAFEAIVRRHGPMVYRVCWRVLQNAEESEDVFQATFLLLAQKVRALRQHASLASWLHGVARRVALKAKARAATRRRHEHDAARAALVPPDDVCWGELRSALDAELALLPEKWRLPLVLCYLEGRTQDEAARLAGWGKTTLRRRLDEARAALGRRLLRRGVGPAALSAVLLADCAGSAAPSPGLIAATAGAGARVAFGEASAAAAAPAAVAPLIRGALQAMPPSISSLAWAALWTAGALLVGAGLIDPGASAGPAVAREQGETPPPAPGAKQGKPPDTLAGTWLMTLPAGFRHVTVVRPLGGGRFALEKAVRFSGVYELRGRKLVLVRPASPGEAGFEWELRGPDSLTLVGQPPVEKLGQNYLGATLSQLPRAGATGPTGEWGTAVGGVRGLIETRDEALRFPAGAPLLVVCRTRNFGEKTPRVYHGRRQRFQLQVVGPDGKPVPLTPFGARELFAPERETAIQKLPPGAEVSETYPLDRLFDLRRPGNYKASFTHEVHFDGKGRPVAVQSKVLLFAIVGRDGGKAGAGKAAREASPALHSEETPSQERAAGGPPRKWGPELFEGAFMFDGPAAFRKYLLGADAVAVGKLTRWEVAKGGTVQIEKALRGKLPDEVAFAYAGGLILGKPGDRVLVVLRKEHGRFVLDATCGAPGLFRGSKELQELVAGLLAAAPPRRPTPPFDEVVLQAEKPPQPSLLYVVLTAPKADTDKLNDLVVRHAAAALREATRYRFDGAALPLGQRAQYVGNVVFLVRRGKKDTTGSMTGFVPEQLREITNAPPGRAKDLVSRHAWGRGRLPTPEGAGDSPPAPGRPD